MKRVVVASALRTPIGAYGGQLKNTGPAAMAAAVLDKVVARAEIDPFMVDDVIFGQCYPSDNNSTVRDILLAAGWPRIVAGMTLDRHCCSGLDSVFWGVMKVQTGNADIVVAGGMESMSRLRHGSAGQILPTRGTAATLAMLEQVEAEAGRLGISRTQADEWSLRSHQRAVAAIDTGRFEDEIVPLLDAEGRLLEVDETPQRSLDLADLARQESFLAGGVCTPGNSAVENDGAAAVVLMSEEKAQKLDVKPLGFMRSCAVVAAPEHAARAATGKALKKANLNIHDIDLIEIQENFAVQALCDAALLNIAAAELDARVNVNGSGIALGHPVAATGTMRLVTLLHEMKRRGVRHGLETICGCSGQSICAVVESYDY